MRRCCIDTDKCAAAANQLCDVGQAGLASQIYGSCRQFRHQGVSISNVIGARPARDHCTDAAAGEKSAYCFPAVNSPPLVMCSGNRVQHHERLTVPGERQQLVEAITGPGVVGWHALVARSYAYHSRQLRDAVTAVHIAGPRNPAGQ